MPNMTDTVNALTPEQALELTPDSLELDHLVGRILRERPVVSWELLDQSEDNTACSFESRREAQEYLDRQIRKFPETWLKECHVGPWLQYTRYYESLTSVINALEMLRANGVFEKWYIRRTPDDVMCYLMKQNAGAIQRCTPDAIAGSLCLCIVEMYLQHEGSIWPLPYFDPISHEYRAVEASE